jgi:protein associated with RNAse G/E
MQRGYEPVKRSKGLDIKLIPENKWWTAIWGWDQPHDLYVDIITPPQWNGSTVTMVDIDLDIVRWGDGRVEVLDEDEFSEHRAKFDYPDRLVDTARSTTASLAVTVEARHEPFGETGETWMARALDLARDPHG